MDAHVILDDEARKSICGQPQIISNLDLAGTVASLDYPLARCIHDTEELRPAMIAAIGIDRLSLILVKAGIAHVKGIALVSHP